MIYNLICSRCKSHIETTTPPNPKNNIFLCNSCYLKWKEKEKKLVGRTFQDELAKAFLDYVNTRPWS